VLRVARWTYVLRGDVTGQTQRGCCSRRPRPGGPVAARGEPLQRPAACDTATPAVVRWQRARRARAPFAVDLHGVAACRRWNCRPSRRRPTARRQRRCLLDVRPEVVQLGPRPGLAADRSGRRRRSRLPPGDGAQAFAITAPPDADAGARGPLDTNVVRRARGHAGLVRGYSPNVPSAPVPGPIPATRCRWRRCHEIAPLTTPAPAPPPLEIVEARVTGTRHYAMTYFRISSRPTFGLQPMSPGSSERGDALRHVLEAHLVRLVVGDLHDPRRGCRPACTRTPSVLS